MYALVLLPEWQCQGCTATQKVSRGCEAPARQRLELAGEKVERCPRRPLLDTPHFYDELFWLYGNWSKGILPDGGTLNTNPSKLVDAIRAMDKARLMANEERDTREQRRQAARKQMHAALTGKSAE